MHPSHRPPEAKRTEHVVVPIRSARGLLFRAFRAFGEFLFDLAHAPISWALPFAQYKPVRGKHIMLFSSRESDNNNYWIQAIYNGALLELPQRESSQLSRRIMYCIVAGAAVYFAVAAYGYGTTTSFREFRQQFPAQTRGGYEATMIGAQVIAVLAIALALVLVYVSATSRRWFFYGLKAKFLRNAAGELVPHEFVLKRYWRRIYWECGEIRLGHIDEIKASDSYAKSKYGKRNSIYLRMLTGEGKAATVKTLPSIPKEDLSLLESLLIRLKAYRDGTHFEVAQEGGQFMREFAPERVSGDVLEDNLQSKEDHHRWRHQ